MTKVRSSDASEIDDRRTSGGGSSGFPGGLGSVLGGGGLKVGGGLMGVLVLVAVLVLPKLLGGASGQGAVDVGGASRSADQAGDGTCSSDLEQIVCGATDDVQSFWATELPNAYGARYAAGKTTLFNDSINTGCGQASAQTGPFYCPDDQHVYLDLGFMQQLEQQLIGGTSDLAEQYIIAHEYGHHVQNLLGTSDAVRGHEESDGDTAHLYSEALELQADCYAGVWINSVAARGLLDSDAEIGEAFDAAQGVGDDYIQSRGGGSVDPDSFTHGTSAQRKEWLTTGFTTGDPRQCDGTFAAMGVAL